MPKEGKKTEKPVAESQSAAISSDGKTCHLIVNISNGYGTARMDYKGPVDPLFAGGLLGIAQASGGSISPQPIPAIQIQQQQPPLLSQSQPSSLPPPNPPPRRSVDFNTIDAAAATVLPRTGLPATRPGVPLPTVQRGRSIGPVQVALILVFLFFLPIAWTLISSPVARQNVLNSIIPIAPPAAPSPSAAPAKPKQSSALPPPPPPNPPAGSILPVPTPP